MGYFRYLQQPVGTSIDEDNVGLAKAGTTGTPGTYVSIENDNVGLAKDTTISSNLGKFDFIGWLFNNGTPKFFYVSTSAGTETTIYTVPTGKKAYILFIYIEAVYSSGVTNTTVYANIYIKDASGTILLKFTHMYRNDSGGIPHIIMEFNNPTLLELSEGYSITIYASGSSGKASIFLVEI